MLQFICEQVLLIRRCVLQDDGAVVKRAFPRLYRSSCEKSYILSSLESSSYFFLWTDCCMVALVCVAYIVLYEEPTCASTSRSRPLNVYVSTAY